MNEQTLRDLLAFIEMQNITLAAQRRNVSQPAYSRRLQAIEAVHQTQLIDRSVRPARPTRVLEAMKEEMERVLSSLGRLRNNLSSSSVTNYTISIGAIHTLACGVLPEALNNSGPADQVQSRIRLKTANHLACFQRLMTGDVSLMLAYETSNQTIQAPPGLVEKIYIATDFMVPVCRPELADKLRRITPGSSPIPLISYPGDSMLGRVLFEDLLTRSDHQYIELLSTGLSSSVKACALEGAAMAWLPLTLIKNELANGELVLLIGAQFPLTELDVMMHRLRVKKMQEMHLWLATLKDNIAEIINQVRSKYQPDMR